MNPGYRKIHLDFHTHPSLTNICDKFDADDFADTLANAEVDCVVLFAKGHYGYAFYNSSINPVHPNLTKDFLPLAAEACRKRGIRTEAYISVCCDYQNFLKHPEWSCRNADGSIARWSEVSVLLDLASPLLDEVVMPFTTEVVTTMPVDGIWFDIVMYPTDGVYSDYVTEHLRESGLADTLENRGQLAHEITINAQNRLYSMVKSIKPDMEVLFNNQANPGTTEAFEFNDVIEVESDPAYWPQYDLALRCRYLSGIGKPHHGLTTRFHRCWGDFGGLRSPAQLQSEMGMIYAAGTPWVSLGDHLHPAGILDSSVYKLIGDAYTYSKPIAKIVENSTPLSEITLLVSPNNSHFTSLRKTDQTAQLGATRLLVEEHLQFSVYDILSDFPTDNVMLLPGGMPLTPEVITVIRQRVKNGQPLLALGNHICGLEDLIGAEPAEETAMSGQHLCFDGILADELIGKMPVSVYSKVWTFTQTIGLQIIADVIDPLFDNTLPENYHPHGPVNNDGIRRPAIISRGNVILCGVSLAELIHTEGAWPHMLALSRLLRHLSGTSMITTDVGPTTEISVHRHGDDAVIHLVTAQFSRGGMPPQRTHTFTPVRGVSIGFNGFLTPKCVEVITGGTITEWQTDNYGLNMTVNLLNPHMVIRCRGVFADINKK
jgi:hypothetical protein